MKQFSALNEFCKSVNISYTDETDKIFDQFYNLLIEQNKVMNLTAITDCNEVELKHFIDSLESYPILKEICDKSEPGTVEMIDMGTGAGFPGIPLAIVLPEIRFMLADSLEKRIRFLEECRSKCRIDNIIPVHGRAEDLGKGELRERFDACVSRAVASMPVLLEYCLPMVKLNGKVVLYKSGSYMEEVKQSENAIEVLGGKLTDIIEFNLPGMDIQRSLIILSKIKNTPSKYPRKAGKPSKSPL